jgi:DNA-binding transcriptional ArsR family regulator
VADTAGWFTYHKPQITSHKHLAPVFFLPANNLPLATRQRFVYDRNMNVEPETHAAEAGVAAAIGEPARARMLYCLVDGRARTSTELALVADVAPSTASVHLQRLQAERLVKVAAQGRHRYYTLDSANVAATLESLSVLAGGPRDVLMPRVPGRLRAARTCYDHIAGALGVSLHARLEAIGWVSLTHKPDNSCEVTKSGAAGFSTLGIDIGPLQKLRRRLAYGCVDWSERRPHLGGALGAALLEAALKKKWVVQERDSRALSITNFGRREMLSRFGLRES